MEASPSFIGHSSGTLADIAERVIGNQDSSDHILDLEDPLIQSHKTEVDDDDLFEFPFVNCSPVSADEIFHNGWIKPLYAAGIGKKKTSLRMLMVEERHEAKSCESVPHGGRKWIKRWRLMDSFVFFSPSAKKSAAGAQISGKGHLEDAGKCVLTHYAKSKMAK